MMTTMDSDKAHQEACKITITNCKRVGKYKMGRSRPISVTFHKKDDKQSLLYNKHQLPNGIYVNEEFPMNIKKNRDTPRPILKLAKSLPEYQDKCKINQDRLIVNGITYTVHDLHQLPPELAPYKASQKTNETTIGFQGELSPWSNFHNSPFEVDGLMFNTAEHWIQYTKVQYFEDKTTVECILDCKTPLEAKRLGYSVQHFDPKLWKEHGYDLCLPGIRAKYVENPMLMSMLKTTAPNLLVECSSDKLWGTGVSMRESEPLNNNKWHTTGWLSDMLMDIRDSDECMESA